MRNILLALLLANILYFLWGRYAGTPAEIGVAVVEESELGPPLELSDAAVAEACWDRDARPISPRWWVALA